jgi:type IV pilus assembly protein PilW
MLRQRGLSLIELMISITIGLVILAAMVALFVNSSRSNRELARTNALIENGRLAMQLIEADLVHAGFWGTFVPQFDDQTATAAPTDVPNAVPDPCLAYTTPWTAQYRTNLVGIPLQVYDSAAVCSGVIVNKAANTDVLIVRHAETCVPGEGGNCDADVTGRLYFQPTLCLTESGTPYVFGTSGYTLHKRDCTTVADKRRFISDIYYVRDYAVTSGDGIPTLVRSQFDLASGTLAHQAAVAMIEGVQGFRVELGVDNVSKTGGAVDYTAAVAWADPDTRTQPSNRGDGSPDGAFVSCGTGCTVAQLMNTTAVKLYVLVRSRDASPGYTDAKTYTLGSTTMGPFNDGFKRHLFVSTVRLPNITGRRESP